MQNFKQKQLALAVSAAVGALVAADASAIGLKSGAGVQSVIAKYNNVVPNQLYKVGGVQQYAAATGKVDIVVALSNAAYDTVKFVWNDTTAAALSTSDLVLTYGTAGTMLPLKNIIAVKGVNTAGDSSLTLTNGNALDSTASHSTFVITVGADSTFSAGALGALRIDNATGNLQYLDSNGAGGDITIKLQQNPDTASQSNGLVDSTGSTLSVAAVSNTAKTGLSLSLAPQLKTRAANGLLNGLVVDFRHPLSATPGANEIVLKTTKNAGDVTSDSVAITGATGVTQTITLGNSFAMDSVSLDSTGTPYASGTSKPQTSLDIALTGLDKADWTSVGSAAEDAAIYAFKSFNTGIKTTAVPYHIGAYDSVTASGKGVKFANVYFESSFLAASYDSTNGMTLAGVNDSVGAAINLTSQNTVKDGATPIVVKSEYDAIDSNKGVLTISFSEALTGFDSNGAALGAGVTITNVNVLREALGNVTANGTSLAALAFNSDLTIKASLDSAVLTLSSAPVSAGTGAALVVDKRITIVNPGDSAYVGSATDVLDTLGGLQGDTATLPMGITFEAASGSATVAKLAKSVALSTATCAAYTGSDASKIASIVCTFPGNVSKSSAANFTDKFRVTVTDSTLYPYADTVGSAANFYEFSLDSLVAVAGNQVTITLPSAVKTANTSKVTLAYLDTTGMLLDTNNKSIGKDSVDIGSLPYFATTANEGLYTMDAKGKLTGASNGDRVTAYLAKWLDTPAGVGVTTLTNGKITSAGDKVATDIVLTFDNNLDSQRDTLGLTDLINAQLKSATPKAVTAYVTLTRTNDQSAGAATGGVGNGNATLVWATANISAKNPAASTTGTNNAGTTYVVQVDPKTGNITGRLTGNLGITTKAKTVRGLAFVQTDGTLFAGGAQGVGEAATVGGTPAKAQAMVTDSSGSYNLFVGADAKDAAVFNDAFVLVTLEQNTASGVVRTLVTSADPQAANFVAFQPSVTVKDPTKVGRVDLGALDLSKILKTKLTNSSNWQLVGAGNLSRKSATVDAKQVGRLFVTLKDGDPYPRSTWTNDGDVTDMALTMLGNAVGVASEGSAADVSTIGANNVKATAAALALLNDVNNTNSLFFLTKGALSGINTTTGMGLPAGWSLVTVPAGVANTAALPSDVTMLLKVGAQAGTGNQVSWVSGDAAVTLKQDEPVFVYSKKALLGK